MILYGPHASAILAGLDAAFCTLQFSGRRRIIWFNIAVMSLSIFIAGSLVTLVFGELAPQATDLGTLAMAAGTLALIHFALNSGIVSVVTALRRGEGLLQTWKNSYLWTWVSYMAGAVAASLVIKLSRGHLILRIHIVVPILTITYFTYKVYLDRVDASNRPAEQMADLHLRTIEALAIAIDAKMK